MFEIPNPILVFSSRWGKIWKKLSKFDWIIYQKPIRHWNPELHFIISGSRVTITLLLLFELQQHDQFTSLMLISNIIIFEDGETHTHTKLTTFLPTFNMCAIICVLNVWTNGDNNKKMTTTATLPPMAHTCKKKLIWKDQFFLMN